MSKELVFDAWPGDDSFGGFDGKTIEDDFVDDLMESVDPMRGFDLPGAGEPDVVDIDGFVVPGTAEIFSGAQAVGGPDLAFEIEEPLQESPLSGAGSFGRPVPDAPAGNPVPFSPIAPAFPVPPRLGSAWPEARAMAPGPDGVYRVIDARPPVPTEPRPGDLSPYRGLPVSASFSIKEECGCSSCACAR